MTHDSWRMTHDSWRMLHDTWHLTHDTWHFKLFEKKNDFYFTGKSLVYDLAWIEAEFYPQHPPTNFRSSKLALTKNINLKLHQLPPRAPWLTCSQTNLIFMRLWIEAFIADSNLLSCKRWTRDTFLVARPQWTVYRREEQSTMIKLFILALWYASQPVAVFLSFLLFGNKFII